MRLDRGKMRVLAICRGWLLIVTTIPAVCQVKGIKAIKSDFSFPSITKIVYAPTWEGRCPPGVKCAPPERAYIFAVFIHVLNKDDSPNLDLEARATDQIKKTFAGVARGALADSTDTTAVGWQDLEDTVCRAHQRKPSIVLAAPYYEDVEYCVRLISGPLDRSYKQFRLEAEANVTLTKNPESPYREPTSQEMTPYGELLVKVADEIRVQLGSEAREAGWHVKDTGYDVTIDGLAK